MVINNGGKISMSNGYYGTYYETKLLRTLNVSIKLINTILLPLFMATLFLVVLRFLSGMSSFWSNVLFIWWGLVLTAMILFILSGSVLEFIADKEFKKAELMNEVAKEI